MITARCNLSCSYCVLENTPHQLKQELTLLQKQELISHLYHQLDFRSLTISGGEALLIGRSAPNEFIQLLSFLRQYKSDKKEEKQEIRYPNKLTPKQTSSNGDTSSMDGSSKSVNTNKGVASAPSKARGSVTENKDNANKDYPIHHNDGKDNKSTNMYSADARQFVTFTTKNGKTFHLIINHDEDSENVMLLTEVSEDDLLNMVEKKETQKEIVKEEPIKEEPKPVKKEESSNMGTYLILILVVAGALGAGYYFKVVKKKENEELEALEDDDDDFFSEADESDETSEIEVEEIEEDEE